MQNSKNTSVIQSILKNELRKALGCTEPIAVAFASAKARDVLGRFPERIELRCSGNIIKNVKGVTVPCSGGLKGLDVAAILGAVGGDAQKELEVLAGVKDEDRRKTREYMARADFFTVSLVEGISNLYIKILMWAGDESAEVTVIDHHTDIREIRKNGQLVFSAVGEESESHLPDISSLSLEDIFDFAELEDTALFADIFEQQIQMNTQISEYGLKENCGANIGSRLLECFPEDVSVRARARAAAASDARMSGCAMPVVINSGSGNQGITVSLPVIEYAEALKVSRETLYRALAISNLSALYVKQYIGSLSAFCGAIVAASGASAAIAFLHGATREQMSAAIVNTLAIVGGIVCDGAKASCAAKISSAVDAAILSFKMSMAGYRFNAGEGIVRASAEDTIKAVAYMGRVGMARTDIEILNLMINKVEL